MKAGDRCFFYHSNEGKEIVGIAEVVKTAYPDPTDKDGKAVAVDIKAVEPVKQPVTLAAIKADPKFKEFRLVRQSRLSVVPVSDEHWKLILKMSDTASDRQPPAASSRCRRRSWSSSSTMR